MCSLLRGEGRFKTRNFLSKSNHPGCVGSCGFAHSRTRCHGVVTSLLITAVAAEKALNYIDSSGDTFYDFGGMRCWWFTAFFEKRVEIWGVGLANYFTVCEAISWELIYLLFRACWREERALQANSIDFSELYPNLYSLYNQITGSLENETAHFNCMACIVVWPSYLWWPLYWRY